MKRKNAWVAILLILTTIGVIIFLSWPKIKLPEVKIAEVTPLSFIATEGKFFKREGLGVISEIMSPKDSASMLLAGKIDYATFNGLYIEPIIGISLKNAPIKIIILTSRYQTSFIVAQPGLGLSDLKTIGIPFRNTTQYYHLLKFIEENSLEIKIITLKSQEKPLSDKDLEKLLVDAKADAILTSLPHSFSLQSQGFLILDTIIDISPTGLVARDDKIEKNPEEIKKVVRAFERTMEFIVTEPEETKNLLLKFWSLEETKENLAMIEEYYSLLRESFDRKNVSYDEGAELLIKLAKAGEFETLQEVEEQVVTQEELDKVFDFRFVR